MKRTRLQAGSGYRSTIVRSFPRLHKIQSLVGAWLLLDFFGQARRTGATASTLTTTIFSQSFLALIVAALLYPEYPPVPFAAANMCLSTLLVSLGACDIEPMADRRRADRVLTGTAPIDRLTVAVARAARGFFFLALLTTGMALPPAILLACREGNFWLAPGYVVLASVSAGIASGALSVTLQFARLMLGSQRAALVAGTVKALLLGGGFAIFALSLSALSQTADALPIGRLGAELLPPYQAAKLLAEPFDEGWRLLVLLGASLVLLLCAAWIGDREREQTTVVRRSGPILRLIHALAGPAPDRGIAMFTATMLWRSPGLRARALPLLGVPAAMAFLALRGSDEQSNSLLATMALQFPAIYLPIVIAFLPQADQPGCRWLFDSAPTITPARTQRAVWLALVLELLLPVQLLAVGIMLLAGQSPGQVLPAAAFALGSGGLAARLMVRSLEDLPFCRDVEPTTGPDLGNMLTFGIALAIAGAGVALLPTAAATVVAAGTLATLAMLLRPPQPEQPTPSTS